MAENDIGPRIKKLSDKLRISGDASLAESGLTFSQTIVMEYIHGCGGKTTQKDVEDHMHVSHPTVVGLISRLEKNGFLTCYMDPHNRRNKIVEETDKALEAEKVMRQGQREMEARLVKGLSEEEVAELKRLLDIVYSNIK